MCLLCLLMMCDCFSFIIRDLRQRAEPIPTTVKRPVRIGRQSASQSRTTSPKNEKKRWRLASGSAITDVRHDQHELKDLSVDEHNNVTPAQADDKAPDPQNDQEVITISRTTFNYFVVAILFFVVGALTGALGLSSLEREPALDEAALGAIVREAIAEVGLSEDRPDRFELVDDDPYLGPEDAPVVIVEFSAYACPFCGRHFEQTFQPLLENYGEHIRYVYRDYPAINQNVSFPAALAAECAQDQGQYWDYHHYLYDHQETLFEGGRDFLISTAETIGIEDMDAFVACLDDETHRGEIQTDFVDGQINGVTGTPAFFINGTFVSGAQPYETFESFILRELQRAGIDA